MQAARAEGGRITLPKLDPSFEEIAGALPPPEEETLRAIHDAWARERGADAAADPEDYPRGPMTGTLVNQFRAEVAGAFDPESCRAAVLRRFSSIAQAVFEVFVEPSIRLAQRRDILGVPDNAIDPAKAKEIADRWFQQTKGDFFELIWVRGGEVDWAEESRWLARRKTWRTHMPVVDDVGADRCPIHPEMAELGGFARRRGGRERAQQESFWQALRYVVGTRMYDDEQPEGWEVFPERWPPEDDAEGGDSKFRYTLELRSGERLSGLALVKRLFPLLSARRLVETIGWLPVIPDSIGNPDTQITAEAARLALRNYPSTAFVAAIPWIIEVYTDLPQAARRYASRQWSRLGFDRLVRSERPQKHRIPSIDGLPKEQDKRAGAVVPLFAVLDGTLHFPRGLDRRRLVERHYHEERRPNREAERQALKQAAATAKDLQANYRALLKDVDSSANLGRKARPSPFYAFLEMDGDSMGARFSSERRDAETTSLALLDFARKARRLIRGHDGVPVYAGADDVLALLTVERVIACASAIREAWSASFSHEFESAGLSVPETSISASIVFADYQVPLNEVRSTVHERLEKVAKDGNNRDSIALVVMKSGGLTAGWVTTWEQGKKPRNQIDTLWQMGTGSAVTNLSSGLAHTLSDRFRPLLDDAGFPDDDLIAMIRKELVDSGVSGSVDEATREELAAHIVDLLAGYSRSPISDNPPRFAAERRTERNEQALLIARFLRQQVLRPYAERAGLLEQ